jgi:predicted kinase
MTISTANLMGEGIRTLSSSESRFLPTLILIGGGAASGKSRIATKLVRSIPNAVLLDKDSLFSDWVDALLAAHGQPSNRDCAVYWDVIRPLEYRSLEKLAQEHLRLGKVVVVDAPLRPELDDPGWVRRVEAECEKLGAGLIPVWIEISPECAHERMRRRSEPRDQWKLQNWDEFVRRQNYGAPRAVKLVFNNDDNKAGGSVVSTIMVAIGQSTA